MDWTQYAPNPRAGTHPVGDLLVRSDNRWKDLVYGGDVPQRVLKRDFDWVNDVESTSFFKHQGTWYHLSQFERVPPGSGLKEAGWDGYHPDSISTGVVVKISSDGEQYKVGSYSTKPGGG